MEGRGGSEGGEGGEGEWKMEEGEVRGKEEKVKRETFLYSFVPMAPL